ncbi:sulfatase family protein [Alterisphingorhabdus coralli]|uniref:Sulfatase-like hydrolase/transferase n=1 Tax=Alterisphingorhabdus coralli TaxID=3071408 RepID=A0AA97F7Q6_9SPHN|nr:sulfatase-like hydrolase/transferase [Parasphingorhabdus sp. SCSIO 66989]WOE75523.1 sulfatase-like hydrolase/transferase [Parasphingorhabdus sp. SCSIO 66989]
MKRQGLTMLLSGLALLATGGAGVQAQEAASETGQTQAAEPFSFGGVFEGGIAGEIDRTVIPRRPDGPPNIVFIIADDLGWPYLGFLGDRNVITPNMDILGRGGVVFERGHSSANHCRPTLQSLVSGLYPSQYADQASRIADARMANGPVPQEVDTARERQQLWKQYETSAIEQIATLPRILQQAGYVSFQSGKWWEQSYRHGGFTHGMTPSWNWKDAAALGDNWFFTFMGGRGNEIGRQTMAPVLDFVEDNAEQPFFLWYGPALPHTPLNPPDRFFKFYQDRDDISESAKLYYANIAWFDWGVGQLLDKLREERLMDNTLIVYVNDNGWQQPPTAEYADNPFFFPNGGPRGKGSAFETAFRTPIIFYWADQIAARLDRRQLVNAIDIMPTVLDYAGVTSPVELPGYSLRNHIEGKSSAPLRPALFGRIDTHRAGTDFRGQRDEAVTDMMGGSFDAYYRTDETWHFVWKTDSDEVALWDITGDPNSNSDVAADHPDLVAEFKQEISGWRQQYVPNG